MKEEIWLLMRLRIIYLDIWVILKKKQYFYASRERPRDIPGLESEESAAQRENQAGIKVLTPSQVLSRLPSLYRLYFLVDYISIIVQRK